MKYDPMVAPDPAQWLETDERERLRLIRQFHVATERVQLEPEAEGAHAAFHAAVEAQLASDNPPQARVALRRLMDEGLNRHDAVHALAALLSNLVLAATRGEQPDADGYARSLESYSAEKWRQDFEAPSSASVSSAVRVGPNQPCPCGSGKKHKRCCGQ